MTYAEAMRRYGSDKPDLRIALELVDVADLVKDCDFKVFAGPAKDPNGRVAALARARRRQRCRARRSMSTRRSWRAMAPRVWRTSRSTTRAKGREGLQSPIIKFLSDAAVAGILERTGARTATSSSSAPTAPRW